MPRRIWIYSQYLWPDGAPTGIYAEQLAGALHLRGATVTLVGGRGSYRESSRPEPIVPRVNLPHYQGGRKGIVRKGLEFHSIQRAFARHIREGVGAGDVVIMISAPPSTVHLHSVIHDRGATAVYWLQDYYPELLKGFLPYPRPIDNLVRARWNAHLSKWDTVVKAAGNLGYHGSNAALIRNWPTHDMGHSIPCEPKTALFSGNLGFAHHIPSLVAVCEELREEGYEVTIRGDGRGMQKIPPSFARQPPVNDPSRLIRSYWETEVHLIAGHPSLPEAVFPSKFWNIRSVGRSMRTSGFTGPLLEEFQVALTVDYTRHLPAWCELIEKLT